MSSLLYLLTKYGTIYLTGTLQGSMGSTPELGIRKQDVDLDKGILLLNETKNNKQRYVVMGDDLRQLMNAYVDKCFYLLGDKDYIFTNANGGRMSKDTVYEKHREFLYRAGIPYTGDGNGPRLHDWRHHMAVYSFKQMTDSGLDMYVALPILSAYLGHKTIFATEKYVRLTLQLFPYMEEKFRPVVERIFGVQQMKTTDFATHMTQYFTRYLVNEKGSSPQTVDSYRYAFLLYFEYMESRCGIRPEKLTVSDYTRESILGFLEWLEEERHNSPVTRNYRLAVMKGFVHYLKYEFPDYMEEYQWILGIP